jgi:uncharacterized damage-inducible protein DinB
LERDLIQAELSERARRFALMTGWHVPERTDPSFVGPERQVLGEWLEYHRATLLTKCAGLTPQQLVLRARPPSTLSLLGLVRHLAQVENGWLGSFDGDVWQPLDQYTDTGDPDADFNQADPGRAGHDLACYQAVCSRSRRLVAAHQPDDLSRDPRYTDAPPTLRWVLVHLLEEYARHNGHADLLREAIDGVTGE